MGVVEFMHIVSIFTLKSKYSLKAQALATEYAQELSSSQLTAACEAASPQNESFLVHRRGGRRKMEMVGLKVCAHKCAAKICICHAHFRSRMH